jgi:phage terminase small subunit
MTSRQKEFCRHYLAGLSAPAAAKAAGYAACTAEKNAAYILGSPTIAAYLAKKRASTTLVTQYHLGQGLERMLSIIKIGTDKEAAIAFHAVLKLYKLQDKIASQDTDYDDIDPTDSSSLNTPVSNNDTPLSQVLSSEGA